MDAHQGHGALKRTCMATQLGIWVAHPGLSCDFLPMSAYLSTEAQSLLPTRAYWSIEALLAWQPSFFL